MPRTARRVAAPGVFVPVPPDVTFPIPGELAVIRKGVVERERAAGGGCDVSTRQGPAAMFAASETGTPKWPRSTWDRAGQVNWIGGTSGPGPTQRFSWEGESNIARELSFPGANSASTIDYLPSILSNTFLWVETFEGMYSGTELMSSWGEAEGSPGEAGIRMYAWQPQGLQYRSGMRLREPDAPLGMGLIARNRWQPGRSSVQ
jgi:hypothetical protein